MTLPKSFEFVREARAKGLTVPVVLMGYYNPFRAFGERETAQAAKEAGTRATLVRACPVPLTPLLLLLDQASMGLLLLTCRRRPARSSDPIAVSSSCTPSPPHGIAHSVVLIRRCGFAGPSSR